MSEELLNKVLIEVVSIKEEIKGLATKEELLEMKSEILGDVDRFVKLHEMFDHELFALRHKYERLEERILHLEKMVV